MLTWFTGALTIAFPDARPSGGRRTRRKTNHMKPRHFALCTSLLLAAAVFGQTDRVPANVASRAGRAPSERSSGPLLRAIDANRDGTLSAEELRLAPIALTAFDLDEDGFLLRDEISPASMAHGRRSSLWVVYSATRRPAETAVLLTLDANHDGILQPMEVANATSSLRRLDANHDGAVTADELQANAGRTVVIAQR